MKYILRIIVLPFWTIIFTIRLIADLFKVIVYFILYGGEAITYRSKNETKKIADIWELLRKPGYEKT